jgi:hypothetical protein
LNMACARVLGMHCYDCDRDFPKRRFSVKPGNRRVGQCKKCKCAYNKIWYAKNKKAHVGICAKRRKEWHDTLKSFVDAEKSKPCADCGSSYPPYVMDFDHLGKAPKKGALSRMVWEGWSLAEIKKEIAKCEVVCANCHRKRTHNRQALRAGCSAAPSKRRVPSSTLG